MSIRPLYNAALYVAAPFAMAHLWRRSLKQPEYKEHWSERFGFADYPKPAKGRSFIWIHGVSVGETRAATSLVEKILKNWPRVDILFTHTTPTGRETGRQIGQKHGNRVFQTYLPYDTAFAIKRFLSICQPKACVLMETEVWPNLTYYAKQAGIPIILANARLSEKSLNKGKKAGSLIREAMERLDIALAQSEADAQRLKEAGVKNVKVCGNLKFDYKPNSVQIGTGRGLKPIIGRRIITFASTRQGEEEGFLSLINGWVKDHKKRKNLWLIVPRHPQRFGEVEKLIEKQKLSYIKRSEIRDWEEVFSTGGPEVILGDSMGEMAFYYALTDVAVMGGSFKPFGSQSIIEPCTIGIPLIVGPSNFNFETAINEALKAHAIIRVENEEQAFKEIDVLMNNKSLREEFAENAAKFAAHQRGATEKTFNVLAQLLSEKK